MNIDIFHIGPQKCATTWVYECLQEHPQIFCPKSDSIHYYDVHYQKGNRWYESWFLNAQSGQKLYDPTPSYIRSPLAAERIAKEHPDAKLIVCLRNPLDRAFAHYWHEKKKQSISYEFDQVFSNYDLFQSYVETSLYSTHLKRYFGVFPKDSILIQRFEDLERNPVAFFAQLCKHCEIDLVTPSVIYRKRNSAGPIQKPARRVISEITDKALGFAPTEAADRFRKSPFYRFLSGRGEYLEGVAPQTRKDLEEIFFADIERLEQMTGQDFSIWKNLG
ncbi:MAG: sulfotransferase [Pseudomonadota bacterium]|nr:sulfotransferase [Pseudomonadota bacterium]